MQSAEHAAFACFVFKKLPTDVQRASFYRRGNQRWERQMNEVIKRRGMSLVDHYIMKGVRVMKMAIKGRLEKAKSIHPTGT